MTSSVYTMDRDQLEPLLSRAMSATVDKLVKDGYLKSEDADKFLSKNTVLLVTKKTVIGKIKDYFYPKNDANITGNTVFVTIVEVK